VMRTNGDVTLNCADLVSIDRDGVRSLLALRDWLRRDGRCLHFVYLSDALARDLDTPVSGVVGRGAP
jgi:anti-anti-sigma regulatory factor